MIIANGTPDLRADLFGGSGDVRVWNLLEAPAEPFSAVLSCELAPGGWVGPHVQDRLAEIVIGLEGAGEATVDGRLLALGAGAAVHVPLGAVLTIDNRASHAPLRYLIIKARG
jgi:quercetin dioxygenase-like cupin family protein